MKAWDGDSTPSSPTTKHLEIEGLGFCRAKQGKNDCRLSLVFLEFFHPRLRPVLYTLGFPQDFATINAGLS